MASNPRNASHLILSLLVLQVFDTVSNTYTGVATTTGSAVSHVTTTTGDVVNSAKTSAGTTFDNVKVCLWVFWGVRGCGIRGCGFG